ncbi:MAG: hypothetical protein GXP14_11925 [Gammaproteobacteria bacterium]|nr:hypothetical protein [Gammaproteobacteria bacterium]
MSKSDLSPYWYRVASLVPQLKHHISLTRQTYKEKVWYVLHDPMSNRQHRLSNVQYVVVSLANGSKTVQQIWHISNKLSGENAPTQDEIIQLLAQLHTADLLLTDITPDCIELFNKGTQRTASQWQQRFGNPLSIRISLCDPEKFLTKFHSFVDPLFTMAGLFFWLGIIFFALVLTGLHWSEITDNVSEKILAAESIIIFVIIYPVVKILHELGHAFAVKKWGGEVHELGVLFLVFIPIPYVDASSASAFQARYQRIIVSSAGIFVDLFLASIALFIWLNVQPGLMRTTAFNIMFISGIATLFFNGNPLLRFDGYYIFSDTIGIPNLATRARRYLGYLSQKYIFGLTPLALPVTPRESFWFITYGVSSFFYRTIILVIIVLFVAQKIFFAGVLIATWAVLSQLFVPLLKSMINLFSQSSIHNKRLRTFIFISIIMSSTVYLLVLLPAPLSTHSEGVVWIPEKTHLRAKTNGFVTEVHIAPGTLVEKGTLVISTKAPLLSGKIILLKAQLNELKTRYNAAYANNFVQAKIIEDELKSVKIALFQAEKEQATLNLYAPEKGKFVIIPDKIDIEDRYVKQGDLIAYIVPEYPDTARVVIDQEHIGLVREQTKQVFVKFSDRPEKTYPSNIVRSIPAANNTLPSAALGTKGGGSIVIDPTYEGATTALEKFFEFDISLPKIHPAPYSGSRVYVSFIHEPEPLSQQWFRSIRQLFLKRFEL